MSFAQITNNNRVRGSGLALEGASGNYFGSVVLVGGTATVATTSAVTGMLVFLQGIASGGAAGELTVTAISDGISFTITSSSGTDARTIAWIIFTS